MSEQCCGRVWDDLSRRHHPCQKAAKYEVEGKHYCGTHNPEAIAKRRAKADAKWRAKNEAFVYGVNKRKQDEADAARYRNLRDALLDRMHGRESAVFSAFYDHPTPQDAAAFDSYLDAAMAASDRYTLTDAGRAALGKGK